MTNTLSSTYASLVTLSGAADNPTTITTTGLLKVGLEAASLGSAWTITNAGSVLGAGIARGLARTARFMWRTTGWRPSKKETTPRRWGNMR